MTDPAIRSQAANEYKVIRSSIPIDTPAAMLVIGERAMAIAQGHTLTAEEVIVMDIGTVSIMENYFKSNPPGPLDLERAIHWIEEAIAQPRKLILGNAILYLQDHVLSEIRQHLRGDKATSSLLNVEDIETAFIDLISAAKVATTKLTDNELATRSAADLLIVRELTHHWRFLGIAAN